MGWANRQGFGAAVLLRDGRVLACGGTFGAPFAECRRYDPVANTWTLVASMSTARQRFTMTLLSDGKVLAAEEEVVLGTPIDLGGALRSRGRPWTLTGSLTRTPGPGTGRSGFRTAGCCAAASRFRDRPRRRPPRSTTPSSGAVVPGRKHGGGARRVRGNAAPQRKSARGRRRLREPCRDLRSRDRPLDRDQPARAGAQQRQRDAPPQRPRGRDRRQQRHHLQQRRALRPHSRHMVAGSADERRPLPSGVHDAARWTQCWSRAASTARRSRAPR